MNEKGKRWIKFLLIKIYTLGEEKLRKKVNTKSNHDQFFSFFLKNKQRKKWKLQEDMRNHPCKSKIAF